MNKFTKLILTSAIISTSGFATDIANFQNGGEVQSGASINFHGQTLTLSEGKSLDVYGSLTGTGTIKCSGDGKVNVYGNTYKQDDENKDAILSATGLSEFAVHTLDESNKGSIDDTITVVPAEALNKTNADLATYASSHADTDLVYVANSSGDVTKCIGRTASVIEVPVALGNANASIEGLIPSSLVMENKLKFTGDNSGFKEGTVTIGTTDTPADVEYATVDSAFQTDTTVEKGSKLTISPTEGLTLSKNLTINGSSKFILNETQDQIIRGNTEGGSLVVTGKLTLKSGCILTLGSEYDDSPIAENPSEYPKVMSWPKGSFSNELTELNKTHYTISFDDGTSLSFYYDEASKSWNNDGYESRAQFNETEDGELEIKTYISESITKDSLSSLTSRTEGDNTYYTVPLKYDISVEIYEDPDNIGRYKTDTEGYDVYVYGDNIMVSSNEEITLKTLSAEDVASPSSKELIYAHDDVFSYTYDAENDSWVRRAQYQTIAPGAFSVDEITSDQSTWRILDLEGTYDSYNVTNVTHAVLMPENVGFYALDESNKVFNHKSTHWQLDGGFCFEGDKEHGLWLKCSAVQADRDWVQAFVEKVKINPWKTLADYGEGYSFNG